MMESKTFPKQTNRQGENKQRWTTIDFYFFFSSIWWAVAAENTTHFNVDFLIVRMNILGA